VVSKDDGLVGKEAETLLKKFSALLAEKWEKPYSHKSVDMSEPPSDKQNEPPPPAVRSGRTKQASVFSDIST
jgi:hypothetical protein